MMKPGRWHPLFACLIVTACLAVERTAAQTLDDVPADIRAQLERGQVPANLPPEVRAQLEKVLAERAAGSSAAAVAGETPAAAQPPSPTPPELVPVPEPERKLGLRPFGLDIFRRIPATFAPIDYGPVDPGYRVGPGDEILVTTWGEVELNYRPVVDRGGTITIPVVGQVTVGGMTVDQVELQLLGRLSRYHASLRAGSGGARSFLSVTLGKLRPIAVFVLGEVVRPGAYTLGAASTVFQALYAAGGPTDSGSLRRIRRYPSLGPPDSLDAYDYIVRGRRENDFRLNHLDVVFVPVIGPMVGVGGAVRRPALYELTKRDSLAQALEYAGGLRADATPQFSQLERVVGAERQLVDVSLADTSAVMLKDGDILTVGAALDKVTNTVTVRGEVRRPQTYGWTDGLTVGDLLGWADGLTGDAYRERADVVRLLPDRTTEVHAVNLADILSGRAGADVALLPYDILIVRSKYDFMSPENVAVYGEVRRTGAFPYHVNMNLADLLFAAGGLTPAAYTRAASIYRQYFTEGQTLTDTLSVKIPTTLNDADRLDWPHIPLVPNDRVFIQRRPDWEEPSVVRLSGEVQFPGNYQLTRRDERILNLVRRAGGLTKYAYVRGVTVVRPEVGRIAVDLTKAMEDSSAFVNLVLHAHDQVIVPPTPQTVTVQGAVGFATSVVYVPGKRIDYYLDLAGGTLDSADTDRIRLVLYGGGVEKARSWLRWSKVPPGSTIVVPSKPRRPETAWGEVVRDSITFIGALATTVLLIIQVVGN